jgi:hypothetical protein
MIISMIDIGCQYWMMIPWGGVVRLAVLQAGPQIESPPLRALAS